MVFDTPEFFVFFAVVLLLYYNINHRWQNRLLVVSSYFFYGWWDWRFCTLLGISTILDWWCGLQIPKRNGRTWLYLSVVGQLSMLGFFKYFNFFQESFRKLFWAIGWNTDWYTLNIILPVGISFYTFQTLSYTIDIGRGKLQPVRSLMDFAVFVSFWPHLVAGPILRATFLLPQILKERRVNLRDWSEGTYFIITGLVKKVAVADVVASAIQPVLDSPLQYSSWQLLLTSYLFALRIYCDFSGYTDIARGTSLFMGFRLQENFRWPYFAVGIADFWNRWHISLGSWLRDYLYISLGGNRHGTFNTYRNLMITMTLGGLWHKPTYNFILWGILHGIMLSIGRMITLPYQRFMDAAFRWGMRPLLLAILGVLTFHLMCLCNTLAVLPDFTRTGQFFSHLLDLTFTYDADRQRQTLYALAVVLAIDIPEALHRRHDYLLDKHFVIRGIFYGTCIALLMVTWTQDYEPFFYFQF